MFIVLMFGFVAFKSGAFDATRSATIKLHVSNTGKSHHRKANDPNKRAIHGKRQPLTDEQERAMMHSSKTIITSPVNWSRYPDLFGLESNAMLSSSKSMTIVAHPLSLSIYEGIFSTPNGDKAKSKGEQLKQGHK